MTISELLIISWGCVILIAWILFTFSTSYFVQVNGLYKTYLDHWLLRNQSLLWWIWSTSMFTWNIQKSIHFHSSINRIWFWFYVFSFSSDCRCWINVLWFFVDSTDWLWSSNLIITYAIFSLFRTLFTFKNCILLKNLKKLIVDIVWLAFQLFVEKSKYSCYLCKFNMK